MVTRRPIERSERSNIIPNRIREVRQAQGLTLDALAERIGISLSSLAKLERSQRTLSLDVLAAVAKALAVSPAELIGPQAGGAVPQLRSLPIIGRIAAGNWKEAIHDPVGFVAVPNGGPNAFGLIPDGDSMDQVVPAGAVIVVDPDNKDLLDGKIYAFMNPEQETTFKRYRAEPARLEPCSSNPNHKSIPLGTEDYRVIGRVIWQASPM